MDIPRLETQANGVVRLYVDKIVIYYSFDRPFAFKVVGEPESMRVRRNDWDVWHAKMEQHMKAEELGANDKDHRVPGPIWEDMLKQALGE